MVVLLDDFVPGTDESKAPDVYIEHAGLCTGLFDWSFPIYNPKTDAELRMCFWLEDHLNRILHRFRVIDCGPSKDFKPF